MNTVILSLYDDNYQDIANITTPNIINYANKFGYKAYFYHNNLDSSRHIYWSKILGIYQMLQKYDRVFWFDIDSLFTNFDVDVIEKWDNSSSHLGIINCLDREPKDETECFYSVSQMLFYNKPETLDFLQYVYNKTQYIGHVWPEQMAMVQTMEDFPNSIEYKPMCKIFNPIDYLIGKEKLKPEEYDMVTVGGGPGAKVAKIRSLQDVASKISVDLAGKA